MRKRLAFLMAASLFACKQDSLPAKRPVDARAIIGARPLVDARYRKAPVPPKKKQVRIVKEGHYLLHNNVLADGVNVFTTIWTIDGKGVEFITEANQFIDRPSYIHRVNYGEKKEADLFLRDAYLEVQRGPKPKSAKLIITPVPKEKRTYLMGFKKRFSKGDHVFKDRHLFTRKKKSSLKVLWANYWGTRIQWDDGKTSELKFGKTRTYGKGALTVQITPTFGGEKGQVVLDVVYPVLR